MHLKRLLTTLLIIILSCQSDFAQELVCNVIVNDEQVETQERQVFSQLQNAISQFMNTFKWTDDDFMEEERIKCTFSIILKKKSTLTNFAANVQIQSLRPVWGAAYDTPVMNFIDDKWEFVYNISDPLIFAENTYTTQLTSLLAYYAYIILGMDYDTFSLKGGTPFYTRALNILNNSLDTGPGWSAFGDTRNRYFLSDNLNDPQFEPFREALYEYHRLGMDKFDENPDEARKVIVEALKKIKEVRELNPTSITINMFFDAKITELLNVFSAGDDVTRAEAVELMSFLDPTNSGKYRKLIK